jgi:16S rRNA (cytosine967-C5)-methyltransferase
VDEEGLREGRIWPQSRGSQLAGLCVGSHEGERVLDLCAAPGGKTTHLAALMEGRGRIVAVEADARRAAALERSARRMRAEIVTVQVADARLPRPLESYDRVLVDPPCSGLGTLQARADLRWRASLDAIGKTSADQFRILDCGAQTLRPGGVLVYSTCTISPTENEHLIADFLDRNPDFQLDDLAADMPDYAMSTPARQEERGHAVSRRALLTLPHRHRTAGFFIARLRRS